MNTHNLTRRLSAILSADVEGYSRLMLENEEETVRTMTSYRTAMTRLSEHYRGHVVDSPGRQHPRRVYRHRGWGKLRRGDPAV